IEKQHHQRKLKADAKTQRQNQHKAQPLADPRVEIGVHALIECEQKIEHRLEHERKRQRCPAKKQTEADWQVKIDVVFLVRVEAGRNKYPNLEKDVGVGD